MRGRLFVFEGGYSTGKTTQSKLFRDYLALRSSHPEPLLLREPGGTPLGEKIRELLLSNVGRTPRADLFLFNAARAELAETKIKPALEAGRDVVLDRFWPSSIVYQGILGGVGIHYSEAVCVLASEDLEPDLIFWLDPSAEEMEQRTKARPDGHRYHRLPAGAVREAYEIIMAERMKSCVAHVDLVVGAPDLTHRKIVSLYEQWLNDDDDPICDCGYPGYACRCDNTQDPSDA